MTTIVPKSMCACDEQVHISVREVEEYLNNRGAQPLSALADELEKIGVFKHLKSMKGHYNSNLRAVLHQSKIPFRILNCPKNYVKCCGGCLEFCDSRCVMDISHRAWIATSSLVAIGTPYEKWSSIAKSIYHAFKPPVDYRQAIMSIYSMISSTTNPKLQERVISYVGKERFFAEHPHKLYYGPTDAVINPVSNRIEFEFYPATGLCPFYVPLCSPRRFTTKSEISAQDPFST